MDKDRIAYFATEKLDELGLFLVEVRTQPGKIVVYIDHPSEGIRLEDCIAVSRYLEEVPELEEIFQKNELEVSSPGMDEPLKVLPQYRKRIGKRISVLTFDGMKREGILTAAGDDGIELEETREKKVNGKKEAQTTILRYPFTAVKEIRPVFSFDKLLK